MVQKTVHLEEFQAHYEAAARKYRQRDFLACFIPLALCGLGTLSFYLGNELLEAYFSESGIVRSVPQSGERAATVLDVVLYLLFLIVAFGLQVLYVERLGRNPYLKCPLCSKFLHTHIHADLMQTGMCPYCKQMILKGELSSEKAAREYYEQKPLADKRQFVIGLKKAARTSVWAAILILLLAVPVYFWINSLEEMMGTGAAFSYARSMVFFSALLLPFAWYCRYASRRLERQLDSENSQPEEHHG